MERISYETDGHLALIGLARQEKRNAFDSLMLAELGQAYTAYEEDKSLRCALLFPHGDHFTGGLDLGEVGPRVAAGEPLFAKTDVDPLGLFGRTRTKPVVTAMRGYCLTIGVELALASDIRIAADDCKFSQIEVQRGIYPFGGATLRLPQVAGWGNAMRWLLTGDFFDSAEALRIGVVQEVTDASKVIERAREIAERVAAQAPLAVAATMASARTAIEAGFETEIANLHPRARELMSTDDAAEGMRSFLERRSASFSGQ